MKLRNKVTKEVSVVKCSKDDDYFYMYQDDGDFIAPVTLEELYDGWEEYTEPKDYWFIDCDGSVYQNCQDSTQTHTNHHELIGNYFETKEEAEKAVEKLKAWKRLKDKGFEFTGFTHKDRGRIDELEIYCHLGKRPEDIEDMEDVDLLFGGEE